MDTKQHEIIQEAAGWEQRRGPASGYNDKILENAPPLPDHMNEKLMSLLLQYGLVVANVFTTGLAIHYPHPFPAASDYFYISWSSKMMSIDVEQHPEIMKYFLTRLEFDPANRIMSSFDMEQRLVARTRPHALTSRRSDGSWEIDSRSIVLDWPGEVQMARALVDCAQACTDRLNIFGELQGEDWDRPNTHLSGRSSRFLTPDSDPRLLSRVYNDLVIRFCSEIPAVPPDVLP